MRGRQGQGTGGPLVTALSSQRPHEKGIRMTTTEYRVTGMTCGHCESSVRSAVSDIDGVKQVEVSAATGKLVITSDAPRPIPRYWLRSSRPDTPQCGLVDQTRRGRDSARTHRRKLPTNSLRLFRHSVPLPAFRRGDSVTTFHQVPMRALPLACQAFIPPRSSTTSVYPSAVRSAAAFALIGPVRQ